MDEICPVSWGFESALTEDPQLCGKPAEFVVYLDCNHPTTIAYKNDSRGLVCKEHAEMIEKRIGICGCRWIVERKNHGRR